MAEEPLRYMRRYLHIEEDFNLNEEELEPAIAADGTPLPPPQPSPQSTPIEKPESSGIAIVRGRHKT